VSGNRPFRHVLPPVLAVVLALGCLLLNKEGLALLREPICLFLILFLAAACWFVFRPRAITTEPKQVEPSETWRWLWPVLALLAGPTLATLFWALDVYVIESQFYVSSYERMEVLPPVLVIGSVAGIIGCVIVILRLEEK
jgi:hypothetical protein